MTAIPEALLKRIRLWLKEVGHGKIVLNADAHAVKSFEFTEYGKVQDLDINPEADSNSWTQTIEKDVHIESDNSI